MNQRKGKNWADYSDDSSQSQHQESNPIQHPTNQLPNNIQVQQRYKYYPQKQETIKQLKMIDQLDDKKYQQIWMIFSSSKLQYYQDQVNYLKSIAKKKGNIVAVQNINQHTSQILVYIQRAYQYIQKGYDNTHFMKVEVSQRNFQNKGYYQSQNKGYNNREGKADHEKYSKKKIVYKQKQGKNNEVSQRKNNRPSQNYNIDQEIQNQSKKSFVMVRKEQKQDKKETQLKFIEGKSQQSKQKQERNTDKQQKKEKKQRNKKTNQKNPIKSSNRFQGIEDLD